MKAFEEFSNMPPDFWFLVKYISQKLGYSKKKTGTVKTYTEKEIRKFCQDNIISVTSEEVLQLLHYCSMRADALNNFVKQLLMDGETAKSEFQHYLELHQQNGYQCKLPMNKQKNAKKQIAYFTAMINILAEKTIQECNPSISSLGFDDDPGSLVYIKDENHRLIGSSSRRFDGVYPSIESPKIVWEIKEYYYTTTFGSRIADGIYETQLDGYEFQELFNRTGYHVYHILFIDAYQTWWLKGRSYLCRIIDSLNMGLVDEVIFGREIFTRWPELLESKIKSSKAII